MCKPAINPYSEPEYADSLVRAEALEREITDLCAQINAANYRLLQLIVALDNEKPWGAWGGKPAYRIDFLLRTPQSALWRAVLPTAR